MAIPQSADPMTALIDKWAAYVQPFPLPSFAVPVCGSPLCNVDDETLLTAPPQMLVHLLRTAAQGGMQVVSPRQCPLSSVMSRVASGRREIGDHVVGSIASPDEEWPTLDDADFSDLLPDQPLTGMNPDRAERDRTKTLPLTSAAHMLKDPILSCLVKGRAVVDIVARPDVGGDADTLAEVIACAWGIRREELMDLDAFTLGIQGDLLRHCIRYDDVFPTVYAPVQLSRSISVGATDVTRDHLPLHAAMDWRRLRVFAEAVFLMCCDIEGLPIKHMRAIPPPGDPTAPLGRRCTLAFRPSPCVAWCASPATFSITPLWVRGQKMEGVIPEEVKLALSRYVSVVKPASLLLDSGYNAPLTRSLLMDRPVPEGETIMGSYAKLTRINAPGPSRGRLAAGTVRNYIYEVVENAPIEKAVKLARYLTLIPEEAMLHLSVSRVPNEIVDKIALKFLELGDDIRMRVASEATRRGHTVQEWWEDAIAQAPGRFKKMPEGTESWAKVAMHLMFTRPSPNWCKLSTALTKTALRRSMGAASGSHPLPAEVGSVERLCAAANVTVTAVSAAFTAYYQAVCDVGVMLADLADEMAKPHTAATLREGAYLWAMRARAFRAIGVHPITADAERPKSHHYVVKASPVSLSVAPSPYRALKAWQTHAMASMYVAPEVKRYLDKGMGSEAKVSAFIAKAPKRVLRCIPSKITRYLHDLPRLGQDMEKSWTMLVGDLSEVAAKIQQEIDMKATLDTYIPPEFQEEVVPMDIPEPVASTTGGMGYYDFTGKMDPDMSESLEDDVLSLPQELQDEIFGGVYRSERELIDRINGAVHEHQNMEKAEKDLVS